MQYRILGKTGLRVSVLGLGGHEFAWSRAGNVKNSRMMAFDPARGQVIRKALDGGINFFDTTFFEEVQSLGHMIAQFRCRDQMIISGMIIDTLHSAAQAREQGQSIESFVRKEMETRLTLLGSDHFDTFLLCNIHRGYNQELAIDIVSVYEKLKAEGKCRFIGASCHEFDRLRDFVLLGLPVDVVMFWHNFPIGVRQATPGHGAPDPGIVDAALQAIDDRGLGKIGMKSISWFQRATPFYHLKAPTHDAQAHRSAIAWQTQIPEVHSSMIAVDTPEQLDENLAALESAPDEGLLYEYLRKAQ